MLRCGERKQKFSGKNREFCFNPASARAPSKNLRKARAVMRTENFMQWQGRSETRQGAVTGVLAGMLAGALDHPAVAPPPRAEGDPLPALWHWVAFPEFARMSGLGADGHPALGGFMPPVPFPRRMWAGGRLAFSGRLHLGEPLERRSEIASIEEKSGATGPMVFVRVAHRIRGAGGGEVEETQDVVYLPMPESFTPPKAVPPPGAPAFEEVIETGVIRLFRFSAATYNAHRIHYDLPYAREVEKYPALVVHGPMQAMLLMEAATRHAGREPATFRFRGVHPMFHDHDLALIGCPAEEGDGMALCTAKPGSHRGLTAEIGWAA